MNDTTIRLKSDTSKCVDISNYGTDDGSNIWLFTCHTNDTDPTHQNQEWTYNSNGTITSVMSGKCMNSQNFGTTDGTNVELDSCSGTDDQKWIYKKGEDMTIRQVRSGLCLDVGSMADCTQKPWSTYGYCNYKLTADARAADLVSRITLEEKVNLMLNDKNGVPRLGVPPFGHTECTHGTLNDGQLLTTLFPQALTVARSFDRKLLHSIARAISDEVRGKHNEGKKMGKTTYPNGLVCWAPVLNICRDPRWGRCQEGYGEDPYLQAELGTQYVMGLQNGSSEQYYEAVATCKHFDVHAGPENIPVSRGSFDAVVSYRDWIETFQPAFKACGEAGALSYMCSYNAINGVPSCANRELLTDLLRGTWKFDGFVVSDCGAVGNVYSQHHFARSEQEAAEFCVKAGCDWNCGSTYINVVSAVQDGYLSELDVDIAVGRVIRGFILLGILDPPNMVPYNKIDLSVVDQHQELARQAAREAIVLLQNSKGLLPLDLSSYKSVAIIGPCANDPVCARGDYDPEPKYIITPMAAFSNRSQLQVNYSSGCKDIKCTDNSGFSDAVAVAKGADFVVYVGGTSKEIEGEGHDRSDISLPGMQADLISMLAGTGKMVVVVLMHGAPVVSSVYGKVDAVVSAGYTGQEAGNAIYDVLIGEYNPAGRLAVTWYTGIGQLPDMVDYTMVNRTYRYMKATPQYYFGYGLSYTTFQYSSLSITPSDFMPCKTVEVKFSVVNTGQVAGDEVTQVYISFKNATVPAPLLKLVGFQRVSNLKPDPSDIRTVQIMIEPFQMTVVQDSDYAEVIEPGVYMVYAGGSQPGDVNAPSNVLKGSFTIVGDTTPLSHCS